MTEEEKNERYLKLKEQLKKLPKKEVKLTPSEVIQQYGYTPKRLSQKLKSLDLNTKEGKEELKKFLEKGFSIEERKEEANYYKKLHDERLLLQFIPTKEGHSPLKAVAYRNFETEEELWDALEGTLPMPIGILGYPNGLSDNFNLFEYSKENILFKKLHFKSLLQLKKYLERHKDQLKKLQEYFCVERESVEKEIVGFIGMEKRLNELKDSKPELVSRKNQTLNQRFIKITEYLKQNFPNEPKYPSEAQIRRWLGELKS